MQYVKDSVEMEKILKYLSLAAIEAAHSNCKKTKRGAVIVSDPFLISSGYNYSVDPQSCCLRKDIQRGMRSELCNAIHAEQKAIDDALLQNQDIKGARLYHVEVKDKVMVYSGPPSCPICSKAILDHKLRDVVLWQKQGYVIYPALEFHRLSIEYHKKLNVRVITI